MKSIIRNSLFVTLAFLLFTFDFSYASLVNANVISRRRVVDVGLSSFGGIGIVSGAHFGLERYMEVGGNLGVSFSEGNPYIFDTHMNLQLIEGTRKEPLSLSLIGGVWGGTSDSIWLSSRSKSFYILPELGVSLSYPFTERLTGRANIVFGPTLGVELGYRFTSRIEGVIAISLQMIGIKIAL